MTQFAIVYQSNAGHTKQYAELLSKRTDAVALPLSQAIRVLPIGSRVVFMGWIRAGQVCGYRKAVANFDVIAVVGVGMAPAGTQIDQVRQATRISSVTPLFTLCGGLEPELLSGPYRLMISMAAKGITDDLAKKESLTEEEQQTKAMFEDLGSKVDPQSVEEIVCWMEDNEERYRLFRLGVA